MLAQMTGSLRSPGVDRRRAPRTRVDAAGELLACPATARTVPLAVQVRDVSATGVGLVHASPLPLGQKYVVRHDKFTSDQPRLYTVVRADPAENGTFSIGLHAAAVRAEGSSSSDGSNRGAAAMMLAIVLVVVTAVAMFLF